MRISKYLIVLCIGVGFLILFSCSKGGKKTEKEREPIRISGISVTEVVPQTIDDYYEVSGTVKAKTISSVSAKIMGEVTGVFIKEGDVVKKGQVLLTIDDRDYRERLRQAEEAYQEALSALKSAEKNKRLADVTYERYKRLYDEKALTRQELDQVETQKEIAGHEVERMQSMVKRAKAGLEEARVIYSYTRVLSPIDGVVTEKKVEIGNVVTPGIPLVTVEDKRNFRLEVYLDERFSGKVRKGDRIPVYIQEGQIETVGVVSEVVPAIDPLTRSFLVKIDLTKGQDNISKELRTGLYARARFVTGKKTGLLVPEKAIVRRGQLDGVYVVDEKGIISYRIVRIGLKYPEKGVVEVISGLNPKERIITDGIEKVVEGAKISE